jgi:hypothetical protein
MVGFLRAIIFRWISCADAWMAFNTFLFPAVIFFDADKFFSAMKRS